ncbi:MAG TPA: hypothetical protein P5081_09495 [Phycisphaerae bacterium]|nr:hypothetical protein [Phycisphaerae bacterium]HRW53109.1 hypothetical protein [Phycisphaerae bacterium]
MHHHTRSQVVAILTVVIFAGVGPAHAAQVDAFWFGGAGGWNTPANWLNNVVPANGVDTYSVFIDNGNGAASDALLDTNITIDNLTIDGDDMLTIDNGRSLRIAAGAVDNAGVLTMGSTGSATYFRLVGGAVELTGGGTILLTDSGTNYIYQESGGALNNIDNTIRGAGRIGWTSSPTNINNAGNIVADQATPLEIQGGGSAVFTNTGVVRAENNATLVFTSVNGDNSDGLVEALDGSTVSITSSTISGGTLSTTGSGAIESGNAQAGVSGAAQTVNVTGTIRVPNGRSLYMNGTIHNTGEINLESTGGSTYLRPSDIPLTLTGGGVVNLSDAGTNYIYRSGLGSFVNMDNTIRGAGRMGWTSLPTDIENHGLIVADLTTPLTIESGANATFTNMGTTRAENGGVLRFNSATVVNTGGVIEALDGSTVTLESSGISGGTLSTTGSGVFESANALASMDNLSTTGQVRIPNSRRLYLTGTIHNSGTITLDATSSSTYIYANVAEVTLTGGGVIAMSDSQHNWIYRQGEGSLTNVDNTIRGSGHLGWTSLPTDFLNQGLIVADQPTPLEIQSGANATFTNTGVLRAENGGTLAFSSAAVDNTGGVIEALDGSVVTLATSGITGGTLRTSGSGAIESVNTLPAIADLTNEGLLRIPNNRRIYLGGTINNTGVIELGSTGNSTYIYPNAAPVSLTGGGTIVLSDNANNWIYRQGEGSLTNVDNTIRGAGHLGWSSAPTNITNQGAIIADGAIELLIDCATRLFDNQGALIVDGGGGLRIQGGFTTSGDVTVNATRTLTRTGPYTQTAGSTIVNGTLNASGDVDIQGGLLGGSGVINDGVTSGGTTSPGASIGVLTIDDTFAQTSAGELLIEIDAISHDQLVVTGAASLAGGLRLDFAHDPAIGESYEVLTCASRTGEFETFDTPCLSGGKSVYVGYTDTSVLVTIGESLDADVDCDCAVTTVDIEMFTLALLDTTAYEAATPNCIGIDAVDYNNDGLVDGRDIQGFVTAWAP